MLTGLGHLSRKPEDMRHPLPAPQPCPGFSGHETFFRSINPLVEVSIQVIKDDLGKLMRVTTTHEDKARPRAGRSSRWPEVTAGDIGKDHVSRGSGLLYFPKSLGQKTFQ